MIVHCNLTESDNQAFRRYVMFRLRKMHWLFGIVAFCLLAFTWFSNKPGTPLAEKIAGLVGVIVVWGIAMLIFLGFWKLISRSTRGRFQGSVGPHTFEISEDIFVESTAHARHEIRVTGLRQVAETSSHFFVISDTGTGYTIPKRDLQNFEALHALQKRVAERVV